MTWRACYTSGDWEEEEEEKKKSKTSVKKLQFCKKKFIYK